MAWKLASASGSCRACVESGQAGLESGLRGGRAHPSPPRGTLVLRGRPAGFAWLLGRFSPRPCSTGGQEGGRPVQGETEGPPCGGLGHLAKTVGPDSQPHMAASASVRSGRLLSPAVRAARHQHRSPSPPRWSLSTRCPWSRSPLPVRLPSWTRRGGALRSWLVGLAGLEHHRLMEKQDSDGGPATRTRLQVSSVQRDPGREGPGTLPAGASRAGSRRPSPAGGEGADGGPATQGCGLSWTPGPGTSTEEVAAWWAQCSWDLGAGGRGSAPGQPGRGVGAGGLEPGGP